MSRAWVVVRREFTEMVRTKMYIIGTILGPVLIASFFVLPVLLMRAGGGGERHVVVYDATGAGLGVPIVQALNATSAAAAAAEAGGEAAGEAGGEVGGEVGGAGGFGSRFRAELRVVRGDGAAERSAARDRVAAGQLDGYLYLPPDMLQGGRALYEGRNATSMIQMEQIRGLVTQVVRAHRLAAAGVEPQVLAQVLQPVRMETRKPGTAEQEGAGAEASFLLGTFMAMAVYFAVVLFATGVMRGVLEEKRDRVVEVLLSSIRARQFIVGKVFGIGAASLLQMLIWVGFAAAVIAFGPGLAARYDLTMPSVPDIPASLALVFLFFFTTGFLLYAALFGAAGAIATSEQEANQLQFPVTIPLLIGFFMMYTLMADADSTTAVIGSIVPFTAPVVMPMRSIMTDVPADEFALAGVLMIVTVAAVMWAAAKIYRIGVLSTGKKPTLRELGRWLRTA